MDLEDEMGASMNHFIAGAIAGTAEHCGMYPVDTIKTHIQAYPRHLGLIETSRMIFNERGILGFFRGMTAVIYSAAPSHAIYFVTYEGLKKNLGGNLPGDHPFIFAFSGATATILSDAVLTPMDTIKQKRQLSMKSYHGTFNCLRQVVAKEGLGALYAGYTTTIFMNIPYHSFYLNVYEFLSRRLPVSTSGKFNPVIHITSGGLAGMAAAAITTPLDVAKTRLQTKSDIEGNYSGMVKTVCTIWRSEGARGLSRGLLPRMIFHSCSASILWTTYEYFKFLLGVSKVRI